MYHYCETCNTYFGDASGLDAHNTAEHPTFSASNSTYPLSNPPTQPNKLSE